MSQCSTTLAVVFAFSALLHQVASQCPLATTSGPGAAGLDGSAFAMLRWDPDGTGPAAEVVVMAGNFTLAGDLLANNIATYDPVSGGFGVLGTGLDGYATSLAVAPDGDLVVAGNFTMAGGVPAGGVARWDGVAWSAVGAGFQPFPATDLRAVAVLPNGDIVVGGAFYATGLPGLARWDGISWSPIPGIVPTGGYPAVMALLVLPNGDLMVGGNFATVAGIAANSIARWDGVAWHGVGGGVTYSQTNGSVHTLSRMPDGSIAVGGQFHFAGGVLSHAIARWTGTAWVGLAGGMQQAGLSRVSSSTVATNGDLVVGGSFQWAGGTFAVNLARFDGSAWQPMGDGALPGAAVLALDGGDILVGRGNPEPGPRRWDGASWRPLRDGLASAPVFVRQLRDGRLLVSADAAFGGAFTNSDLLLYDGSAWTPIGAGFVGPALAAVELANGDLVIGGNCMVEGLALGTHLVRWDGVAWSLLGAAGADSWVSSVIEMPNGDLVAAGTFSAIGGVAASRVARWNGVSWSPMGGGLPGSVAAAVAMADGSVVVAGSFPQGVARWDGAVWTPLGGGLDGGATRLVQLPDGDLVVAGTFSSAGGVAAASVARWDGVAWSPMGAGFTEQVTDLAVLPNGDPVAGLRSGASPAQTVSRLVRWDGQDWSPLLPATIDGLVLDLLATRQGELLVGGDFDRYGVEPAARMLEVSTPCPAAVASTANACTGNGSTGQLDVETLPWTGGTFASEGIGLPAAAVVFAVTGLSTVSLPLSAVFASAAPGCTLLVTPDFVDLTLTASGVATAQMPVPNDPALAGAVFHHQMVPLALDPSLAVTATNALTLTIGSF